MNYKYEITCQIVSHGTIGPRAPSKDGDWELVSITVENGLMWIA